MIADAIDTLITLGWAFLAWLVILAAACALVLTTIAAAIIATCRGLYRLVRWAYRRSPRPAWAHGRLTARRIARTRTYEEAA